MPVPTLRPFRGLRYDPRAGELSRLICPPYDVIGVADRDRLLARDPHNAVRVEFPVLPGHENGGYAQAARMLASWRKAGAMRVDASPSLYVYEEHYRLGQAPERVQRGVFGRLLLEPLGDGIRPHERTLSAPKEDRLRLLRATATNTSPIILLSDAGPALAGQLDPVTRATPDAVATDDASVTHRLWVVPGEHPAAAAIADVVSSAPLTIADGHHRYETALRYREESGASSGDAPSRPEDFVLALVLGVGADDGPTILPTHRVLRGDPALATEVIRSVHGTFRVEHRAVADVVRGYAPPFPGGPGRIGVVTSSHAGELVLDRGEVDRLLGRETPRAVRSLDVAVLDAVLRPLVEDHPDITVSYTHDAAEAADAVGKGDVIAAFLLAPTALESVVAVAAAGAVMPQKSTYFYPKAATGLVMYPLE